MYKPFALVSLVIACACGDVAADLEPTTPPAAVVVPVPAEEPAAAPRPFSVVAVAPVSEDAVRAAVEAWNAALGYEALELAAADAAPEQGRHVYVSSTSELAYGVGGVTDCFDGGYCTIRMRPDLKAAARTIAHEIGHVLGGGEHSDTPGTLMFWQMLKPSAPIDITAEDVARVHAVQGIPAK